MNVLYFCHADFVCNSMGHIAGFAVGLRELGFHCAAAIPGDDLSSAAALGANPPLRPALFADTWEHPETLFPKGQPADIIHAWTPREHVRRAVERCRQGMPRARLVIHLEDNEEHLTATALGDTPERLKAWSPERLAEGLPVHLSHPHAAPKFLQSADGVTGIVETLKDFVPGGVPFRELPPGVDFELFRPEPPEPGLREALGIRPDEKVLVYPGNSHFANDRELQSLYDAVFLLNRQGVACRLIRAGLDTVPFGERFAPDELARWVLHLGFVEHGRLPRLLRLADVLVQPGQADVFNRYRLPSKLPEFLAMGRPVLLPRANVGLQVRAGIEALVLETGAPEEIAACCRRVLAEAELARGLAEGAVGFARRHFDPARNARKLARFYRSFGSPWRRIGRWLRSNNWSVR